MVDEADNNELQESELSSTLNRTTDENPDEKNTFLDYDPNFFSPLFLYRPQNDVIGSLIVHSSSEGAGRYELGRKIGMNTRIKGGNRRVSTNIQAVLKAYPDYIGQYQKMEGKYRTIKYFLKDSEPEKHMSMMKRFEELVGTKCPFNFGEVLKFPNTKLNTLRISDITMKRMLYILEILKAERFILTHIKMVRYIQQRDADEGYPFRIDKKSANKCLLALERHGFCRVLNTEVEEDGVKRPFEIITVREITSVNIDEIQQAIKKACEEFASNNRIFPTGVARPFRKSESITKLLFEAHADNDDDARSKLRKKSKIKKTVPSNGEEDDHYKFLRNVLKQKRDLPTASEKTISSLAASYKRRKFMTAVSRSKRKSFATEKSRDSDSQNHDEDDDEVATTSRQRVSFVLPSNAVDVVANSSVISDKEFSAVMDSASMANIKAEVVNAIHGDISANNANENDSLEIPSSRKRKKTDNDASTERRKKKRALDEIDIMSQNRKIYMRSRFSPRERDMLILIRSVSFFLNPIHRFWLDPAVMRNIMHEYVPESRCKTANSLMAAGNRDLSRSTRMAHLQYIVKTLSSYKEMRDIRNKLPYINMQSSAAKASIFNNAFETAYNLLFRESQSFPTINASDEEFDVYIVGNNLQVTSSQEQDEINGESTQPNSDFPRRSLAPNNESDARHCINFNMIMSVMLHDMITKNETAIKSESDESFLDAYFIKQIGSKEFSETLEILHRDVLISKVRSTDRIPSCELQDAEPALIFKNQITCSVFYRHFFNHHYNNEIVGLTANALDRYKQKKIDETATNDPGGIVLLSECLALEDVDIDFSVPSSFESLFQSNEEKNASNTATKQLRYLENADLHIDLITLHPANCDSITQLNLPELNKTISALTHKVPLLYLERAAKRHLSTIVNSLEKRYRMEAKIVYKAIEESGVRGLSEEELVIKTLLEPLRLKIVINVLVASYDIFPCGIDTRRYVSMRDANCWIVRNNDFGFFPRPWSQPNGDVNCHLLRWMSEAILVMIQKKPGMLIQELVNNYAFVIQPIVVEEILCLLEIIGCCHICAKPMKSMNKTSEGHRTVRNDVRYAMPVHNSLQLFAEFFKEFDNF